jgi:hypothetical protein
MVNAIHPAGIARRRVLRLLSGLGLAGHPRAWGQLPAAVERLERDQLLWYVDEQQQRMPVVEVGQWLQRRQAIVAAMESVMGTLPGAARRCPLEVKVEDEWDGGSYVRRSISYQSEVGCRVPAYLLIPKRLLASGEKAPAILCLHGTNHTVGHGSIVGLGDRPNRNYAVELAERGMVTLAPNYPLLAQYQPDLKALGWRSGSLKAVWDNQRALDMLGSLSYVEASRGFGCIGHSLGGHNGIFTAVFDPRIQVIVSSCGFDSFRDYYAGDESRWLPEKGWCQQRYMPELTRYRGRLEEIPFDFSELIGALAPRRVLVIAPRHDSNFAMASVDRMIQAARPIYALYRQPDRLRVEYPDCEHDFPADMRQLAYDFLASSFP